MTTFRERIIGLAHSLNLSREQFTVGPFIDWPAIQKKIESRFIIKDRSDLSPLEWPEHFKGKPQLIPSRTFEPYEYLDELLPDDQIYWLILQEQNPQQTKLWLFQGYIRPIKKVLSQLPKMPFYVIAKKYEWLLYNANQETFIGLGELPERPAAFKDPEPNTEANSSETPEEEN